MMKIITIIHPNVLGHLPIICVFSTCMIVPGLGALCTEHAGAGQSSPHSGQPPTLGVLEVKTRYSVDNTTGFSAVRKGKST